MQDEYQNPMQLRSASEKPEAGEDFE